MTRRKFIFLILLLIAIFTIFACASDFEPNQAPHFYITNTQGYHSLSGVRLIHEKPHLDNIGSAPWQAIHLTPEWIEFYIDGRKVWSINQAKDGETYLQLPQGKHRVDIVEGEQGLFTLGSRKRNSLASFECVLGDEDGIIRYDNEHHSLYVNFKEVGYIDLGDKNCGIKTPGNEGGCYYTK